MEQQSQIVKPFEVRQDELIKRVSHECVESGLPAGALVLIFEKILVNLRQEAHRAVMNYREQEKEEAKSNQADHRIKERE